MPRAKTPNADAVTKDQAEALAKHGEPGRSAVADDYERALLEERHGYEVFGRDDRVADVDAELERHRAARARAAAAPAAPQERSAEPQETAAGDLVDEA